MEIAVALTTAQTYALYQILDVPYNDSVVRLDGANNLLGTEIKVNASERQAVNLITARLAEIAADETTEALLASLLDEWNDLGTLTVSLDGGLGGLQGISWNPERDRAEIRRRVVIMVPFTADYIARAVAREGSGISSVFLIR